MKWQYYIMVRVTLFFLIGIVLGFYCPIPLFITSISLVIGFITLVFLYFREKKRFTSHYYYELLAYLLCINLGMINTYIHQDIHRADHYTKYVNTVNQTVIAQITTVLKPASYRHKYYAQIQQIGDKNAQGKILLLVNDSLQKLTTGDIVVLRASFAALNKPRNPYGFDYANYLKKKQIYLQLFANDYLLISHKKTLKGIVKKWRNVLIKRLENRGFSPAEFAIFKGLLLGDKSDINTELRTNYSQAGVMHILAISGLHIGIILYLLNFIFKPLGKLKNGALIKTIIIVFILWFYALLTGLSPSVVRSVTMFSFVAVGMNIKRNTNIINTLFVALFTLLLFKPNYIYDVGFQLSFTAVFGIVLLQPKINNLLHFNTRIVRYFWELVSVSLAAQISVLPLSLYYFNQFPSLFLLSNLVLIPTLFVFLGLGLLILVLASFSIVFEPLIVFYNSMLYYMNTFIHWVASQEQFIFKNIHFNTVQLIVSYGIIVFFVSYLYTRKIRYLIGALSTILVFQTVLFYHNKDMDKQKQWLVFHKSKQTILGYKTSNYLQVFTRDSLVSHSYFIQNYRRHFAIDTTVQYKLKNCYHFTNDVLLCVDSLGVYKTNTKARYILLSQSPKINLARLIDWHKPSYIIADGSNYKSYVDRWKNTCNKKGVPFWNTFSQGYFVKK